MTTLCWTVAGIVLVPDVMNLYWTVAGIVSVRVHVSILQCMEMLCAGLLQVLCRYLCKSEYLAPATNQPSVELCNPR